VDNKLYINKREMPGSRIRSTYCDPERIVELTACSLWNELVKEHGLETLLKGRNIIISITSSPIIPLQEATNE